jgi:hypothetical protein
LQEKKEDSLNRALKDMELEKSVRWEEEEEGGYDEDEDNTFDVESKFGIHASASPDLIISLR